LRTAILPRPGLRIYVSFENDDKLHLVTWISEAHANTISSSRRKFKITTSATPHRMSPAGTFLRAISIIRFEASYRDNQWSSGRISTHLSISTSDLQKLGYLCENESLIIYERRVRNTIKISVPKRSHYHVCPEMSEGCVCIEWYKAFFRYLTC